MYFDNAATTIHKPQALIDKMVEIMSSAKYGNPSRSSHMISQNSMLAIYKTKKELAKLCDIKNPSDIVFTQNASYGLNFLIKSLVTESDHIITSITEHNSVLRPLYQSKADLSFVGFNENYDLEYNKLESLLRPNTRFLIINAASNLLGNVNDLDYLHNFATENGLIMIVDLAQSLGIIDIDISKYGNSLFAFTGHKSLYGPSGTGGIIKNGDFNFKQVFSGGSGIQSFDKDHPETYPTIFEIGTSNYMSQIALESSLSFINSTGISNIYEHTKKLTKRFYEGVENIGGIKFYSKKPAGLTSPIVSLNLFDIPSDELSLILDEKYNIQTRPSSHCAPLIHKHLGTEDRGIVRFSFSYFNTEDEIDYAIKALREISAKYN